MPRRTCFRVPHGTVLFFEPLQSQGQDIARRILVSIQKQTTMNTAMGSFTERLLDKLAAARALLAGPMGRNLDDRHPMDQTVGTDPL